MIKSLKITDVKNIPLGEEHIHNAEWLHQIEGEKISFGDSVTFLCGPNGSGKTSLLTMMGRYFHCEEGGIPRVTRESVSRIVDYNILADVVYDDDKDIPKQKPKVKNGCSFDCDGSPVFFVSGSLHTSNSESFGFEHLLKKVNAGSAGEGNMRDFRYLTDNARKIHEVDTSWIGNSNEFWQDLAKLSLFAYGDGKKKKVKPTIILDEVESNLDALNQFFFFKILFEQLSQWMQVIFTSHSVLAFLQAHQEKNVKVIETEDGYFDAVISELQSNGVTFGDLPKRGGMRYRR